MLRSTPAGVTHEQVRNYFRSHKLPLQHSCLGAGKCGRSEQAFAHVKGGRPRNCFRHVATDDSQKDVYPFKFEDMAAQRQLSEKGRDAARQLGSAFRSLGIPVGEIYTSKLNRAVENRQIADRKGSDADQRAHR